VASFVAGTALTYSANTTWLQWNNISTTGSHPYVWDQWVSTGTATSYTTQEIVWTQWHETEEEARARAEQAARARDEFQRRQEERNRERLARQQELAEQMAAARVLALELLEGLVPAEDRALGDLSLILVRGSDGHDYRIETHRRSVHGNIVRIDEHGCVLGRACVAPAMYDENNEPLPHEDGWAGQYLGLKFDAEEFLSHANWSETYRGCQQPDLVAA
jgi:hypothetical protein